LMGTATDQHRRQQRPEEEQPHAWSLKLPRRQHLESKLFPSPPASDQDSLTEIQFQKPGVLPATVQQGEVIDQATLASPKIGSGRVCTEKACEGFGHTLAARRRETGVSRTALHIHTHPCHLTVPNQRSKSIPSPRSLPLRCRSHAQQLSVFRATLRESLSVWEVTVCSSFQSSFVLESTRL